MGSHRPHHTWHRQAPRAQRTQRPEREGYANNWPLGRIAGDFMVSFDATVIAVVLALLLPGWPTRG